MITTRAVEGSSAIAFPLISGRSFPVDLIVIKRLFSALLIEDFD